MLCCEVVLAEFKDEKQAVDPHKKENSRNHNPPTIWHLPLSWLNPHFLILDFFFPLGPCTNVRWWRDCGRQRGAKPYPPRRSSTKRILGMKKEKIPIKIRRERWDCFGGFLKPLPRLCFWHYYVYKGEIINGDSCPGAICWSKSSSRRSSLWKEQTNLGKVGFASSVTGIWSCFTLWCLEFLHLVMSYRHSILMFLTFEEILCGQKKKNQFEFAVSKSVHFTPMIFYSYDNCQ